MRRALLLTIVLAAASVPPARADDPADERFRRAEIADRALGDTARAEVLYREAAELAEDPALRATARLRAAACLRRLGRDAEARAILDDLAASAPDDVRRAAEAARLEMGDPPTPPPPPEAQDEAAKLGELRRELDESRDVLVSTYERAVTAESQHADLLAKYKALESEVARRAAEQKSVPSSAEEALAQRVRDLARQRENDARLAAALLHQARLFHRQGRFKEARDLLHDAEARDPSNHDVRALLASVSAPLGEREALFERALDVAALGREVRSARLAAEVESLVDESRRRQSRGDYAGSAAPAEDALARLDAWGALVRDEARLRGALESILDELRRRGVARTRAAAPAEPPGAEWTAALVGLLEEAGREVSSGLLLRFHDASLASPRESLPPVAVSGAAADGARGFGVGPPESSFASLLEPHLAAAERDSGGRAATFRVVGSTIVALADAETQRRIVTRIASLRQGSVPVTELRVVLVRASRGTVASALAKRGLATLDPGDGTLSASVPPGEADALVAALASDRTQVAAEGTWRAASLRAFRVEARFGSSSFAADVLPVAGAAPGASVRASVVARRAEGAALRTDATAGAAFAAGGALVLAGLPDPERADGSLALVVATRGAAAAAPGADGATPSPLPAPAGTEFALPAVAAGAEDPAPLRALVTDAPAPSRREAILRRLSEAVRGARIDFRGSRFRVEGGPEAEAAARTWLSSLALSPPEVRFEVRVHEVSAAVERELAARTPRLARPADRAFSWAVLRDGEERARVERLLAQARAEVAGPQGPVSAAPTARTDWAKLVTSVTRGADGIAQTSEEGLVVSLRPFGRSDAGATDLDVSIRARRAPRTGPGAPSAASAWSADVSAPVGRGEALLVLGRTSPFAVDAPDLPRIAVIVRVVE